jgi:hypothetical protein
MELPEKAIYWPYSDLLKMYYGSPIAGLSRCRAFCDERNKCKGGKWIVHTKQQYDEWYEKKGKHLEHLGLQTHTG